MTRCAVDYGEVVAGILGGGNSSIPPELDEAFRGRAFFFALYFEGLRAVADLRARGTRLVFEDWPRSVADAFELAVNGRKIKFEREDRKAVVSILRDGFNSEVVSYGSRRESIVVPKTMSDYRDLAQQHIKAAVELLFRGL